MDPRFLNPVDLWLVTMGPADAPTAEDLSDDEDRRRFEQIVLPARRRQFAFRRRVLRYVLGRYVPRYSLAFEASGKPYVKTATGRHGLRFSTSSSRDVCAVCVCDTGDAGIDIEANPVAADVAGVLSQFVPGLSSPETAQGVALQESLGAATHRRHLAVMSWCRLEAYTKLHGRTLHQMLFEAPGELLPPVFAKGSHHVTAVANLDHVCVVAQQQPFHINRIHQIDFARIARASAQADH